MSSHVFFQGQAEVKSLSVTDQPATRTEVVSRIATPGGELAVLTDGDLPVRHLAYVELITGKLRGNHFHKTRHERFYLISGEVTLHLKEMASAEEAKVSLKAGDLVIIGPNVAHAFVPLKAGHALEFAPERFDGKDVYRAVIAATS